MALNLGPCVCERSTASLPCSPAWHPLQVFVGRTETVGDVTTTCLTVVPIGCYQTKTDVRGAERASLPALSGLFSVAVAHMLL